MFLDNEEMANMITDPNRVQSYVLNSIEKATNGEYVITDPTNPFVMLMELAVTSAANSVSESINVTRKLYPNLATSKDDIYHHLSDQELVDILNKPAETPMVFYINIKDLRNSGHREPGATYVETIIPIGTEVTVHNITFTTLNKISVKLYDNGKVFVEQLLNDNEVAVNSIGILKSGIVSMANGEPWIIFETILKQVKRYVKYFTTTPAEGFNKRFILTTKYYYSNIYYKNNTTDNEYKAINKTYSDSYIDHNNPTVYINILDSEIKLTIPDIYLLEHNVNGEFKVEIYETLGKIYLPLNKFSIENFKIKLGDSDETLQEATMHNIAILANSRTVVDGGVSAVPLEDLKNRVINNSTGALDVPITNNNLVVKGKEYGFDIKKSMDIITDRLYVGYKSLPYIDVKYVYAKPDIYFNTVSIVLDQLPVTNNIYIDDDYFVIKSNTVFKLVDSKMVIIDDLEKDDIKNNDAVTIADILNKDKYYINPYYYIINTKDDVITTTIYDLDRPMVNSIKITAKNTPLVERVNTDQYGIYKKDSGYEIKITILANDELKKTNMSLLKAQLSIPLAGSENYIHFVTNYKEDENMFVFTLESDYLLTTHNTLYLNNGISELDLKLINLEFDANIYIYTTDTAVTDDAHYLANFIVDEGYKVVLNKEELNIKLGNKVEYLWGLVYNTFTERKYLKHTYDRPLYYKEDVYEEDPDTGSIFKCVTDEDGNEVPEYKIIHKKNDPVLDEDGNQVYEFRKGDIILKDGMPVIDQYSGVERHIDILMLDYGFYLANSLNYKKYLTIVKDTINKWIMEDLTNLNNNALENTKIVYRNNKQSRDIKIASDNTVSVIPYAVKPHVILYVSYNNYTMLEIEDLKSVIGTIIHLSLETDYVNILDMEATITEELGENVLGAKISNIDTVTESKIFTIMEPHNTLSMDKYMTVNTNNELIVKYNIDLNIVEI